MAVGGKGPDDQLDRWAITIRFEDENFGTVTGSRKTFVVSKTPKAANLVKLSGGKFLIAVVNPNGKPARPGARRQGRRRPAPVSRYPNFDTIQRAYLQDVWRIDRGQKIFARRSSRGIPWPRRTSCLALAAAEELRVPLPLASLLRDRFLTLMAHGGDELDWSAIGGLGGQGCRRGRLKVAREINLTNR